MNYHGGSLPVYNISVPSQLLFAMPTDSAHSVSIAYIPSLGKDTDGAVSCDIEIPAILLEILRPDLAQGSKSTGMEVEGGSASESLESTSIPAVDVGCFDVEIVDLMGED